MLKQSVGKTKLVLLSKFYEGRLTANFTNSKRIENFKVNEVP